MSAPALTVSVVIPLYNHEAYVASALASLQAQTLQPHEVIIVDDGSTDASLLVAREWADSHGAPYTVLQRPHEGAHNTINTGIRRATGELVAVLNSDDLYHPGRLAECARLLSADPGLSAVCTGLSFIDGRGKPVDNAWYRQARQFYDEVQDLSLGLINGNFIMTTSNLVVRRSIFDELGYFSALRYAHDLDFFLRLVRHGKRILIHEPSLLTYRIHPANTIKEDALRVKVDWAAAVAYFVFTGWGKQTNWDYYARLAQITDRHNLTRLLSFFHAFYASLPPSKLACDAFTRDPEFSRFIYSETR